MKNLLGNKKSANEIIQTYGILGILILVICFFSITTETFATLDNLITVLRQVSIMGIVAVGMTFVALIGGLDLSVGSNAALLGVITAKLITEAGLNPLWAIIIGILIATFAGFLNGVLVSKTKIPALVVALGAMNIYRGIAYLITGGLPIYGLPRKWTVLSQGYLFKTIPIPVIIMLVIFILGSFFFEEDIYWKAHVCIGEQ